MLLLAQTDQGWLSQAVSTLTEIAPDEISVVRAEHTIFSPMDFMHCPRGAGRPKKKRFGAPSLLKTRRGPAIFSEPTSSADGDSLAPKKRGRGRPKGARNKSKDEPAQKRQKKTLRERAEEVAAYTLNDDSETCHLCLFRFDDPVKKDKTVTRCTICEVLVHEPCLVKTGCDCEFD